MDLMGKFLRCIHFCGFSMDEWDSLVLKYANNDIFFIHLF